MAVVLALTQQSLWAASSPTLLPRGFCRKLHLQKQGDSGQNPLGWLLLSLQLESPHVGGSPLTGLVHRTEIDSAAVLLLRRDCPDEHHRQGGRQLLQLPLGDDPSLRTRIQESTSQVRPRARTGSLTPVGRSRRERLGWPGCTQAHPPARFSQQPKVACTSVC